MNKRIKKKRLQRLKAKLRDLIESKNVTVTARLTDLSNIDFQDIRALQQLFEEVNVQFKVGTRK